MYETIYFVMEIIGTVAFSISGAIIGIQKKMDVLGVVILGVTTAVGGGVIRDLILGITPPMAFRDPVYFIFAVFIAIVVFIPSIRESFEQKSDMRFWDGLLLVMDSIGLGIFTVVGIRAGYNVSDFNVFLLSFVGVVTGVGGGVLRDIFAQEPPYIFHKHFYASASIIGSIICMLAWNSLGEFWAMLIGTLSIIILRLIAVKYNWELPKA